MIRKIIVPIDGSKHSDKALSYALDLAGRYSAEIKLLSVAQPVIAMRPLYSIQPMMIPSSTTLTSTALYVKEIEAAHKNILEEALKKAKDKTQN